MRHLHVACGRQRSLPGADMAKQLQMDLTFDNIDRLDCSGSGLSSRCIWQRVCYEKLTVEFRAPSREFHQSSVRSETFLTSVNRSFTNPKLHGLSVALS
jgi:hypothetical protein